MTDSKVVDEMFSFPASLNCPGSICCTPTHLHLPAHPSPLLLPPTTKHAAAEMFYSVSCTTVARSACMSDVEFEYIWHRNLNDLVLNEIRFVTPCIPLGVTFNSCSFSSLGKKALFHNWFACHEVWGCFILPSERASYAMQMWLGSSWAVAAEFMCFCQAFARLTFWGGGNSLLCIFWSGCACTPARKAHLHRITSVSKDWKLSAVIQSCRGTIWCSEAFPWYFKLEGFSYITMTPQCTLVACDCGVSSRPRFMFGSY